jgi:hypothetical protein
MNEQQLAAVKQVFKDLKWVDNWIGSKPIPECVTRLRKAITALQSIISQDALDKKAENAHELGLDYEPAVQEGRDWSLLEATQESLREHMAEIKRLKAAQPAPVQHDECVVCGDKVRVIPRPWVGLTDEEVEAYDSWADFQVGCGRQTLFDMVRAIEAKLKEKNHG